MVTEQMMEVMIRTLQTNLDIYRERQNNNE